MHSGNVGYAQNLDVLVRAATFLRDLEDVRFVVIGSGARQAELVELRDRLGADQVIFLPISLARCCRSRSRPIFISSVSSRGSRGSSFRAG